MNLKDFIKTGFGTFLILVIGLFLIMLGITQFNLKSAWAGMILFPMGLLMLISKLTPGVAYSQNVAFFSVAVWYALLYAIAHFYAKNRTYFIRFALLLLALLIMTFVGCGGSNVFGGP